ncbi:hypothetical protein O3P69_017515 [Scylla paramamosain]|uniref:Targeting protein for Xklp2 n=2 Tax=Scylla paramamosain TaxID=85552 RepID=A0AAW0U0M6_SCYPA
MEISRGKRDRPECCRLSRCCLCSALYLGHLNLGDPDEAHRPPLQPLGSHCGLSGPCHGCTRMADNYEFNAPKFFDFSKGDIEVDESYFDTVSEMPQKTTADFKATGQLVLKTSVVVSEAASHPSPKTPHIPRSADCPFKTPTVSERVSHPSPKTPAVPKTTSPSSFKTPAVLEPSPKTPVPEVASPPAAVSLPAPRSVPKRISQAMSGLDTVGVRQSPRLAAIAKALRRNRAARKSFGKPGTGQQQNPKTGARKRGVRRVSGVMGLSEQDKADLQAIATFSHKSSSDAPSSKPLKLTKPEEFHFATDSRLRGSGAPAAAEAPAPASTRPHLGPTRPQEFHFATDARVKGKGPSQGEEQEYVDFTRSLRSSTTSLNKDTGVSRTVPQPFNLTESRRRNAEEPSKFVSVAELNLRFHTKTPQRFRTKRAGSEVHDDTKRIKSNTLGITVPHTPQLTTRSRTRTVNCLSQQQMEIKAFEEAQKHTFKARPVNKKVLEAPILGASVEKKLPTVPEPFNITDTKKAEAASAFKREEHEQADESILSVNSVGQGKKRSATKVMPFSFDLRDKTKQQQKEEKIKKFIEEEKSLAEFHAQPMPVFESGLLGVPAKRPPTPTQPQPFNLQADQRGMVKQEKFKAQLKEESQLEAEQRKFRARSGDVVHKAPFVPEKSQRPLTEISSFALNTEVRAGKRSEYDLQRKVHEEEILMAKKLEEERQAAEEAAEIARLRQEAVHKANPVPKFKPVTLQLPHHPVTIPKSPRFATESRLRSRSRVNSTFDVSSATYTAE